MNKLFYDKQQEIEQLEKYVDIIISKSESKWHVAPGTFFVTIDGAFERTFPRAELESFELQIKYLQALENSVKKVKEKYVNENLVCFLRIIENIRNRCNMCSSDSLYVHDPLFEESQSKYNYIKEQDESSSSSKMKNRLFPNSDSYIYNTSDKDKFNLGPKDYYSIGKIILKKGLIISENDDTMNAVFNTFGFIGINQTIISNFKREVLKMKCIDPLKIGKQFVNKLSQESSINLDYKRFDLNISKESYGKLVKFLKQFSDEQTVLIAKVPKPGHTYHLIQPSYIYWCKDGRQHKNYLCPLENILFCAENNNFQDSLNNLSNQNNPNLYFIVHPENLRSDEIKRLKTFILSRRNQNMKLTDDKKKGETNVIQTPKVMIITSLPASFFDLEENNASSFNEKDIEEFAIFNAQWRRTMCNIHNDTFLFSSNVTGVGKTYRINKILNNATDRINNDKEISETIKASKGHIYFDITTKEIPETIKEHNFIHISISPELFLNNFQIFDQLYRLIQYGFFIFQSGNHISYSKGTDIISTFLIEIPNLDDTNAFKNFYDFPIAPSNNKKKCTWEDINDPTGKNINIYDDIKKEFDEIGVKENFENGLFHLTSNSNQIQIKEYNNEDNNVINLMKLIFDDYDKIKTYKELIERSKKLFFENEDSDKGHIDDNRIISKVKKMIEDYSELIVNQYKDDEKKRILFKLTLRTVLYIWHFTPPTTRSIILLVPQRIMTTKAFQKENGWIFVGFYSKRKGINSDFDLIQKFKNSFKNDNKIHILSEDPNSKNDDMFLQTQFFKTILLFLPEIDIALNSSNLFNIAFILLSLFSNMNHFPKDHFCDIINDFGNCQKDGAEWTDIDIVARLKEKYNEYGVEWTEMDERLYYYFKENNKDVKNIKNINALILQLKSKLGGHENIWNIIKISFSKTYFARFIEIILKVYYNHFTILQGETGCGKTSVIRLFNDILSLVEKDDKIKSDIRWKFEMIDFHGNYLQDDFDRKIKEIRKFYNMDAIESESNKNERIIIFLDEVNTSPAYYYVIDHIQNTFSKYFSYIGAINELIEVNSVTRKLSRVGIPQSINRQLSNIKLFSHPKDDIKELTEDYDANKYAYNVKEDQESVKSAIIYTDPQEFDEDDTDFANYFPDEEKNAIRSIITKILLQWENNKNIDLSNTINLITGLISLIFRSVRSFLQLRAVFSYRDVHRCITIFTYVFDYFSKIKNKKSNKNIKNTSWEIITSTSAVIAIYISLICRFSQEEIEVDEISERIQNHPFDDFLKQPKNKICMHQLILDYASSESNWPTKKLPYINDWKSASILLAYAKCMKYVKNEEVYPLPSLMLHLLILSLTVSASFKDINANKKLAFSSSEFFTCLIIGMPGTSKSKAVELYKKYHLKASQNNKSKHKYFMTTYLCSRTSDSDSLLAQFMNGAWFINDESDSQKSKKAIVILEEIGLANYNPSRPLKILHPLCDKGVQIKKGVKTDYCKVIPIQLSNYQIDFANMNRGFLVCAGLPTDSEYYSSIAFGRFLRMILQKDPKMKVEDLFTGNKFSSDILYKITQNERKIFNYEGLIDLIIEVATDKIKEKYEKLSEFIVDYKNDKEFYKKVLEALWKVTQDSKNRPSFYPMRPLFDLIENVSDLKNINYQELTFNLNSFITDKEKLKSIYNQEIVCQKEEPLKLLNQFLKELNIFPDKKKDIKILKNINSVTLYHSFIFNDYERKALLIRTENYEAYRFIYLLEPKKDRTHKEIKNEYNFVPFQFQDVGKNCQHKFDILFKALLDSHNNKEQNMHIFNHVGNDPFSDYIIDILNSINQKDQCPTAILKGFPVYLPKFPENIKFVFIINENEIYNHELKNPIPYPLIDRLDHMFLNKQILKKYHKYFLQNTDFDDIKAKYLLDLPLEKEDEEKVKKNQDKTKKKYYLNYDKSDFDYLIEALKEAKDTKDQAKGNKILSDHFENTFIKNFNDLLKLMIGKSNGGRSFYSAVVFTRTPIYETTIFDENENYEIIKDSQGNIDEVLNAIDKSKNIILHSDIFNIPDDNTINNALSIINSMTLKIIGSYEGKKKKKKYIIIFHISENRIPEGFGSTCYFSAIWIQSLSDFSEKSSLIQEICQAIYTGELHCNSPLLSKVYAKISNDIKEQLEVKQNDKFNMLFSSKGAEIKGLKKKKDTLSIVNIIDSISKEASKYRSDEDSKQTVSFKDMQKTINNMIEKIEQNLKEDKEEKEQNNKILKEELYNFDLESTFLSTVSHLVDTKFTSALSIVIKYLAAIKLIDTNRKTIEEFIEKTYKCIVDISGFIKKIDFNTFSSPSKSNEVNNKHPELLFCNILKPYFDTNIYYNSLNKMNLLIKNLPLENLDLTDVFAYINNNYYSVKPNLPFNEKKESNQISINDFKNFFDSRGLFAKKEKDIHDLIDFMKERENGAHHICPNLYDKIYPVNNIKTNINLDKWKDIEYKQFLLSDCNKNFIDKCEANDNPHPCIIYSHFINVDGFTFNNYNDNDPDGKIYKNQLIPWIINFFLYGSFNNYKQKENFLLNITNFIDLGLKSDHTNFLTQLSLSTELKHFIFDFIFTEYCKKGNNNEKLDSFDYLEYLDCSTDLQKLFNDHADISGTIKDSSIPNNLSNNSYDPSDFDPFKDESVDKIKKVFKEIKEIELSIANYGSWKAKSLNELGEKSILENIRMKLFKYNAKDADNNAEYDLNDCFGTWLLDSKIPLLVRQVYEVCKAMKNDENERTKAEFKILQRIINPWNDEDESIKYFWEWFVDKVKEKSFDKDTNLLNLLKDNPMKDILNSCLPYYTCKYEEEKESNKITKYCIVSKRNEIKTFFIERLLYSNTILLSYTTTNNKDKTITQLFDFMTSLPFAEKTKDLCILANFINEILAKFRNQINLLFLIINLYQNCEDLLEISHFTQLINDQSTENQEALKQALISADKYNKGINAGEKLKSYINKLIDINNKTILLPDKKKFASLKFRLICKANIHSNISLMNTFLPALAHLQLNTSDYAYKILPNALKVLIGNKEAIINKDKLFEALPSIFDFSEGSYAHDVMKIIEKIKDNEDIFRFPINGMVNSLRDEFIAFKVNNDNKNSYRIKIWEKIKEIPVPTSKPDYSKILNTLIPLFEEYDETIEKEHIFFKWDNNSMPETLEGLEAAAHFLRTYKIDDQSLFDIIDNAKP